jgi:hypothetical protein
MNTATTAYAPLDDEELSADDIAAIDAALAEDAFPFTVEHLEAFCRCIGTRKELEKFLSYQPLDD